MRNLHFFVYILLAAAIMTSCGQKKSQEQASSSSSVEEPKDLQAAIQDDESKRNIVQIAAASKDHTTLVTAVKAAGLAGVLANPGPLTVFAPTNEAFDKLPEGTVENLLKPENKKTLMKIIQYHAAAGTFKVDDLKKITSLDMATGDDVTIEVKGDDVYVNGGKILASIDASNGVVHVIDKVLLPPEK